MAFIFLLYPKNLLNSMSLIKLRIITIYHLLLILDGVFNFIFILLFLVNTNN